MQTYVPVCYECLAVLAEFELRIIHTVQREANDTSGMPGDSLTNL